MNIQTFIQSIEQYFGKYENQVIKKAVEKFVGGNWVESELPELLNVTIKKYSTQYKSQPDVSFFNTLWEEKNNPNLLAESAWINLLELKTVRSIFCTDVVTQETIKNMGGIEAFLEYRNKENNWCKTTFILTYNRLLQMGFYKNQKSEIMICDYEKLYPRSPYESFLNSIIIIGDQQEGKLLLSNITRPAIENKTDMKSIGDAVNQIMARINNI